MSRDGSRSLDFHQKCDIRPNTITFIKAENGSIFGGYTSVSWSENKGFQEDESAFIFSVTDKAKFSVENRFRAVYHASNYLTCFGHDIVIYSSCDQNDNSFSSFGDAYKIPEDMDYEDEDDEL